MPSQTILSSRAAFIELQFSGNSFDASANGSLAVSLKEGEEEKETASCTGTFTYSLIHYLKCLLNSCLMLTLFIFVSEELEQPQSIVKTATKKSISATGILPYSHYRLA